MKTLSKRLDLLFSKIIRDANQCHRCLKYGVKNLQCAHLISRSYRQTRWNAENAICLCSGCHMYFTHHPLEWEEYINQVFPGRLQRLKRQALKYSKLDHKKILADLQTYAKKNNMNLD